MISGFKNTFNYPAKREWCDAPVLYIQEELKRTWPGAVGSHQEVQAFWNKMHPLSLVMLIVRDCKWKLKPELALFVVQNKAMTNPYCDSGSNQCWGRLGRRREPAFVC